MSYDPLQTKIWEDTKFQEYGKKRKLVFLYLITNPLKKVSGIYEISPRTISHFTSVSLDETKHILQTFSEETILYDFKLNIVYVKNYFKYHHSIIGNPSVLHKSIMANIRSFPHAEFWMDFNKRYQEEISKLEERLKELNESKKNKKPLLKIVDNLPTSNKVEIRG